jgi:hypothetical protein
VTSYEDARLERIRTLLHRLARVRDGAGEAELIGMITVETGAVRRARARVGVAVDYAPPPAMRPRADRRRALRA